MKSAPAELFGSTLTEQLVSAHKNANNKYTHTSVNNTTKGNIPLMRAFWSSSVLSCPDLSASTASNHLRSSALWFGAAIFCCQKRKKGRREEKREESGR